MSNPENHNHIVPYRTYVFILVALVIFTFLSILVTRYELGPLAVTAALVFASIKCKLVFMYFMHLKFDERIYGIMVAVVLILLVTIIVGTFMDYSFR